MLQDNKHTFKTNGFLLRAPLYSMRQASSQPDELTDFFEAGLYLASKSLHKEFLKRHSLSATEQVKLKRSLAKYWIRACTRPTPFATFAGLCIGKIGASVTSLLLPQAEQHHIRLRLDMDVIELIIARLHERKDIFTQLHFTVNNSLYKVASGYRFAEYQLQRQGGRKYHLSNLLETPYLLAILNAAKKPVGFMDLINLMRTKTTAEDEDIIDYISELITSQVLVSELEPTITGDDVWEGLIIKLTALKGTDGVCEKLRHIHQLLRSGDIIVGHFEKIDNAIADIGLGDVKLPDTTLQADLFLNPLVVNLNTTLVEEILRQIKSLFTLTQQIKRPDLEDFKKRFIERYEAQTVPLIIALDADLGLGYAEVKDELSGVSPLVDGLPVAGSSRIQHMELNALNSFSLKKYEEWQQQGKDYIEITEDNLELFASAAKNANYPESMHLMGSLFMKDGQLDAAHFSFDLSNVSGPSAGSLLGRFTYGDEKMLALSREFLVEEEMQHPDTIFAEIAHWPDARLGNILLRPLLRKYEIPYVGLSGAPEAFQIKVDDLWVKVVGNEVVLWSKKHNRRVLPRLTTAHNFSYKSLPIYKFLCDLQAQGLSYIALWNWGMLDSMTYLPRVVYKSIILKKARWTITEKDLKNLPGDEKAHDVLCEWRIKSGLPNRVVYMEGGTELLIDFNEYAGWDLFIHYLKKYKTVTLEEFLFTEENAVVHNEQGEPFTNEIIIPLTRASEKKPTTISQEASYSIKRTFLPGSEWVYYKIYSGAKSAEMILKNHILPFIENGLQQKLFSKFFFLRYKDETSHIRLRIYAPNKASRRILQDAFFCEMDQLKDQGIIEKIVCDTYDRELERYGGDLIETAEALFFNDSLAILRFINLLEGPDADRYRMFFALRGIDMLLDDFELSITEKHQLLSEVQKSFFQEFNGQPALQKALNEKYRQHQKDIFLHMDVNKDAANDIDDAVSVFQIRSKMNGPVIAELKIKAKKDRWTKWLPSYIHMFMNRLFIAQQRKYELVIYHFLEKYYTSQIAIQKSKTKPELHHS